MDKCKYITISSNILSDKRLNSTDKLVYGIIESACRIGSGNCTLNNKSISDILGISKGYVKRAIAKLEKLNLINKKQSYEAHGKKGNVANNCDYFFGRGATRVSPRGVTIVYGGESQ